MNTNPNRRPAGRRLAAAAAFACAAGSAVLVSAATAGPASAGTCTAPISSRVSAGTWRLHAGPDLASPIVGSVAPGQAITVYEQAINPGGAAAVAGFGASAVLDRVDGGWLSDLASSATPYQRFAPRCDGAAPAPAGLPASARDIGYNPFAARYGNQCTFYGEAAMKALTGRYMPVYGNAYQWAGQAAQGGWTVGAAPARNSVAVFPRGAFGSAVGHVGMVVDVAGDRVRIRDYNWNGAGARLTDHWVTVPAGTQFIYSDR